MAAPENFMKILVAEDDTVTRKMLSYILEREGYEVLAVSNGKEAWEVLKRGNIQLVISDWIMPELDGLSLCKRLRRAELLKYVYVIIVTAKNHIEDLIEGLDSGADDFIFKPINRAELLVKLKVGERILRLENELVKKNMELRKANELLTQMTLTDSLMGIGNRRYFHMYMDKIHSAYVRYGTPYCIAMADIDNFKSYNDTYGHGEGDKVLGLVGRTIKKTVRKADEVFRYGGEEIVIVFINQTIEGGITGAERVRESVEKLSIRHDGNSPFGVVTVSIGVASSDFPLNLEPSWDYVLKKADAAVYMAKRNGKNQVCSASPEDYRLPEEEILLQG